jgi:hypothetical protein
MVVNDQDFRQAALENYATDDIEIDSDAEVSHSDTGAWVAAWVWVSNKRAAGLTTLSQVVVEEIVEVIEEEDDVVVDVGFVF